MINQRRVTTREGLLQEDWEGLEFGFGVTCSGSDILIRSKSTKTYVRICVGIPSSSRVCFSECLTIYLNVYVYFASSKNFHIYLDKFTETDTSDQGKANETPFWWEEKPTWMLRPFVAISFSSQLAKPVLSGNFPSGMV